MNIEAIITQAVLNSVKSIYNQDVLANLVQIQKTRKEFTGDITLVVFPFLKISKKSPEQTANDIGSYLKDNVKEIAGFNIVKGFLNIEISSLYWLDFMNSILMKYDFGISKPDTSLNPILVEYSSPNTNKPLHLGHVRNNLLGYSISKILEANGQNVKKVNLVNDRGIHICKSMLAWQKIGNGETPELSGKKGDHLVGEYYVAFDKEYKKQIELLKSNGEKEDDAKKKVPIIIEAQEMLLKWEKNDPETVDLWKKMNSWVYSGFDETYKKLGVSFDKIYYESQTYLLGKSIVQEGLSKGVLFKKEDGSVWIDLTADGLDQKLLLRSDGTSVYMTQDLGTAHQRYAEYSAEKMIYVVGNEQDYHFKVLSLILQKMGYAWAKGLVHLSYGMVELPEGKMKSREGTVVDADDLIEGMIQTAREMSEELGKLEGFSEAEKANIFRIIGLGALKYFILKVDPKKNMTFDPKESIDFNGNTGPFIQYTYARIRSVMRKAKDMNIALPSKIECAPVLNKKEIELIKYLYEYPSIIKEAAEAFSPALLANYSYELVKEYNQFYHDFSILKEENSTIRDFRLLLSDKISEVLKNSMSLLGIEMPDRM